MKLAITASPLPTPEAMRRELKEKNVALEDKVISLTVSITQKTQESNNRLRLEAFSKDCEEVRKTVVAAQESRLPEFNGRAVRYNVVMPRHYRLPLGAHAKTIEAIFKDADHVRECLAALKGKGHVIENETKLLESLSSPESKIAAKNQPPAPAIVGGSTSIHPAVAAAPLPTSHADRVAGASQRATKIPVSTQPSAQSKTL